jgi:hypothetical protein
MPAVKRAAAPAKPTQHALVFPARGRARDLWGYTCDDHVANRVVPAAPARQSEPQAAAINTRADGRTVGVIARAINAIDRGLVRATSPSHRPATPTTLKLVCVECIDTATKCLNRMFEYPGDLPAINSRNRACIELPRSGTSFAHVTASLTGSAELFRDQEG